MHEIKVPAEILLSWLLSIYLYTFVEYYTTLYLSIHIIIVIIIIIIIIIITAGYLLYTLWAINRLENHGDSVHPCLTPAAYIKLL